MNLEEARKAADAEFQRFCQTFNVNGEVGSARIIWITAWIAGRAAGIEAAHDLVKQISAEVELPHTVKL